ncbi:hypothetical protein [Priestia megaterium]|uniref:hypothetical protein n=1 Tax=Priestia megaterium TaxID=1404 RepID=UPI002FFE48C8
MIKAHKLTELELNNLIETALKDENFKRIIGQLKKFKEVNEKNFKTVLPIKFNVKSEEDILVAQSVTFDFGNEVKFTFYQVLKNNDPSTLSYKSVGTVAYEVTDEHHKIVTYKVLEDDSLIQYSKVVDKEKYVDMQAATEKDNLDLELSNENYTPDDLDNVVDVQDITDGCISGGYIWCGRGCSGDFNKPKYINTTDLCCYLHDSCYKRSGQKKANCSLCDAELCSCIAGESTKAKSMIEIGICFPCGW